MNSSIRLDDLMIAELKEAYRLNSMPGKIDCSDDVIEPDEEFLYCLRQVLGYYMPPADFKEWLAEIVK